MINHLKLIAFFSLFVTSFSALAVDFTVGVTHSYPPFVMKASGTSFYGFDISLVNRVCKDLAVKCRFKAMTYSELHTAILNDSVDIAVSSIVITPERLKTVGFSMPYMLSKGRLLVKDDAVKGTRVGRGFLDKKRIGVIYGTVFHDYVEKIAPRNARIFFKKDLSGLVEMLANNQLDVIVMGNPTAIWVANKSANKFKVVGRAFAIGEGIGVAVANRARKYIPNINRSIESWQKDGTFEKMYNNYFNTNDN